MIASLFVPSAFAFRLVWFTSICTRFQYNNTHVCIVCIFHVLQPISMNRMKCVCTFHRLPYCANLNKINICTNFNESFLITCFIHFASHIMASFRRNIVTAPRTQNTSIDIHIRFALFVDYLFRNAFFPSRKCVGPVYATRSQKIMYTYSFLTFFPYGIFKIYMHKLSIYT